MLKGADGGASSPERLATIAINAKLSLQGVA